MTWSVPLFAAALAAVALLTFVAVDLMATVEQLLEEVGARAFGLLLFCLSRIQGAKVKVTALAYLLGMIVATCEVSGTCLFGRRGGQLSMLLR